MMPPNQQPPPQPDQCIQWAVKGEVAIRKGLLEQGLEFMRKALDAGSTNMSALSAIYSQMGSAYCEMKQYKEAFEFLTYDHILTKLQHDRDGEAKSVSNLSNFYKLQRDYDNAAKFAHSHLDIGKELDNKKMQSVAYFNLGSLYYLKGKETAKNLKAATTAINVSVVTTASTDCYNWKEDIQQAIEYFQANLQIVEANGDRREAGRTYGSLGNCYYVVRQFDEAVRFHSKRLQVAQEFGDKESQRKAYSNLANAYVFLGDLQRALEYFRLSLSIAMELDGKSSRNRSIQAQACFNLATASVLNEEFQQASDYHIKHLTYARELRDIAGEARAHASLSTVYKMMSDYPKAVYFMARRRSIAKQMRDPAMVHSAEVGIKELLDIAGDSVAQEGGELLMDSSVDPEESTLPPLRLSLSLNSIHESGDCGLSRRDVFASDSELSARQSKSGHSMNTQEDLFDLISRLQSKRLDDQRCEAPILADIGNRPARQRDTTAPSPNESMHSAGSGTSSRFKLVGRVSSSFLKDFKVPVPLRKKHFSTATLFSRKSKKPDDTTSMHSFDFDGFKAPFPPSRDRRHSFGLPVFQSTPVAPPRKNRKDGPDNLIDQLMQAQARRMDEQRATLFPGAPADLYDQIQKQAELEGGIDEQLLEMVARAQGQRMNEQRSELGGRSAQDNTELDEKPKHAPTIPEDDLTELVARMAKTRIEEQRAHLPEA